MDRSLSARMKAHRTAHRTACREAQRGACGRAHIRRLQGEGGCVVNTNHGEGWSWWNGLVWVVVLSNAWVVQGCGGYTTPVPEYVQHEDGEPFVMADRMPDTVEVQVLDRARDGEKVWVDGFWRWAGRRWVWIPGRWEQPAPGCRYARPSLAVGPIENRNEGGEADGEPGQARRNRAGLQFRPGHWHPPEGGTAADCPVEPNGVPNSSSR